jgi:hypothetical protein
VVLGIAPMLLLLARAWRSGRRRSVWTGVALGALAAIVPLLLVQWRLWANPFWTNYQAYWWGYMKVKILSPFGFGASPWSDDHSAFSGFRNTLQNLARVDLYLLGLPGGLALAVYGFFVRRRRSADSGVDRAPQLAVFAGAPLTYALLFFYFWSGLSDAGPQLYHAASALLLPFAAAGLCDALDRARRPTVAAGALLIAAGLTFWPTHLGILRRAGLAGSEIPRLAAKRGVHHALVFTEKFPWFGGHERTAVLGRPLPHPDLSDDVLYLQTHGTPYDREVAAKHFPDRALWVLRQTDGMVALLPMDEYTGEDSLRAAAQPRDLALR